MQNQICTKNRLLIALLVYTLISISVAYANPYDISINDGVNWLNTAQLEEGNWTEDALLSVQFINTCESAKSLYYLNQTTTTFTKAMEWINNQEVTDNYLSALKIETLSISTNTLSDAEALALKQNSDGGWGIDEEHLSSLSSSIQVLRALKSAQYNNDEVLDKAIEYIVSNQNDDGGFGVANKNTHTNETLKESNIYITSLIILTCKEYNIDIGSGLLKASEWLQDQQNADGGWGKSWEKINNEWSLQEASSVWETAWAYMALIRTGSNPKPVEGESITIL